MNIRTIFPSDRNPLAGVLQASFRPDEIAVALELIDEAIAGSDDYCIRVAARASDQRSHRAERPGGRRFDQMVDIPGGIAGYICYGATPMTDSTYDLYWIAVHPAMRGCGVANALITAMERDLGQRGAQGIRVETSETESYGAARRLYERHAYSEVGRLPDFYRPGDGLIIYYKKL